jgi:hypothetical protein
LGRGISINTSSSTPWRDFKGYVYFILTRNIILTFSEGTLSLSVTEYCYITCAKTRQKVIIHYLEEGWLGKAQNKVEGVIFTYDPDNDVKNQKIKDVPDKDIIGRIEGSWMDKVYYTLGSQPFAKSEVCNFKLY